MRAPTGTLLGIWLLVGAALVVVAGCSDDPGKASNLPSKTPTTASSSSSPSPDTPEEQVEAAVRDFYEELTAAARSQDTSRLRSLMTRGCPCYGYVKSIEQTERDDQTAPDAAWRLESLRVHDLEGETAVVEVEYVVSAYEVLDSSGDVVERFREQTGHVDLSMINGARGWIVGNVFDLEA